MEHQEKENLFTQADLSLFEPDYGAGMRKIRGILDYNQKEASIKLGKNTESLKKTIPRKKE